MFTTEDVIQQLPANKRDRVRSQIKRWQQWGIIEDQLFAGDLLKIMVLLEAERAGRLPRDRATRIAHNTGEMYRVENIPTGADIKIAETIAVTWRTWDQRKTAVLAVER